MGNSMPCPDPMPTTLYQDETINPVQKVAAISLASQVVSIGHGLLAGLVTGDDQFIAEKRAIFDRMFDLAMAAISATADVPPLVRVRQAREANDPPGQRFEDLTAANSEQRPSGG